MIIRCGPSCWSIAHASCSHGRCSCRPGYSPQVTTKNMNTITIIIIISINNFTLVLMFIIPITTIFANTSSNRYMMMIIISKHFSTPPSRRHAYQAA